MNWVVKSHMMQQYMKAFKKILDYTCKATNGGDVLKLKKINQDMYKQLRSISRRNKRNQQHCPSIILDRSSQWVSCVKKHQQIKKKASRPERSLHCPFKCNG